MISRFRMGLKNERKTFYICSYGGSGSYMLTKALRNYGKVYHIHSRNPPENLQYIGSKDGKFHLQMEWFNGINIPENEIHNYYVIYIYRNPISAIYARNNIFSNPHHLDNIECDSNIELSQVLSEKKDLYKLEEFFDNYTSHKKRNYKIICVKYEDIFTKKDELSNILNIGPLFITYKREEKIYPNQEVLLEIYNNLIQKMNSFKSLVVISNENTKIN